MIALIVALSVGQLVVQTPPAFTLQRAMPLVCQGNLPRFSGGNGWYNVLVNGSGYVVERREVFLRTPEMQAVWQLSAPDTALTQGSQTLSSLLLQLPPATVFPATLVVDVDGRRSGPIALSAARFSSDRIPNIARAQSVRFIITNQRGVTIADYRPRMPDMARFQAGVRGAARSAEAMLVRRECVPSVVP
jgi:hypothetical protein